MGGIQLLLGKTRRRRRAAIPSALWSETDAWGHPTALHITDSWRRRRAIEQSLERDDHFTPAVRVFSELLRDLWDRFGDGRAIFTRQTLDVAADLLIAEAPGRWPWLEATGASEIVGAELAGLLTRLEACGQRSVTGTRRDGELNDALDALRRRLDRIPGLATEADALTELHARIANPDTALQRWLERPRTVLFHEPIQSTPLRTALVIALGRAWAEADAQVVLTLETGRDLGGREAGSFFEYEDIDGYTLKPFEATRPLRKALFDGWIATGEASIHIAREHDVIEVEPWSPALAPEPPDLSDRLHSSAPLPARSAEEADQLLDTISIRRAPDPHAEVAFIADQVHAALLSGEAPGDCVVALPDLQQRADAVRHAFEARGIPHTLAAGSPLVRVPATKALLRIATLAAADFPARALLQLVDQLGLSLPLPPLTLLEWCRAAGVRGGEPTSWWPALQAWARRTRRFDDLTPLRESLDALSDTCATLRSLDEPATVLTWHRRLLEAADQLQLFASVEGDDRDLKAWSSLLDVLQQWVLDLSRVSEGAWPASRLATHLERAISRATWFPDAPRDDRVAVVGVLELRGLTPARVWLGGLARGLFPQPRPASGLVPGAIQRRLEPTDPVKEARYLFCSLLRNAIGDPRMRALCLSWPSTRDGRHLAPSPILSDLLALPTEGGAALGDWVVRECPDSDPVAPPMPEWDRVQAARQDALQHTPPGAYLGVLERPPPLPASIPVTAFETYLRCPARYAYDRILRLHTEDAWTEELEPRRRGTALHRILEAFLAQRGLRPLCTETDPVAAAATLHQVASEILDDVEAEGGFDPVMQAYARTRWLAGLIDSEPKGLLRAWLDLELDPPTPTHPVAVEWAFEDLQIGPARLRGSIDRVDRMGSTLSILDYKTGSPPAQHLVHEGISFQPIAYAEALARAHPDARLTAAFLSLKRPDALRSTAPIDLSEDLRRPLVERAAEAAEALAAGHYPTTVHGPAAAGCAWCPHRRICRADHTRSLERP